MMLPTHAIGGMLLALPVALAVPEFGPIALGAGLLGGVVPDLDLYRGHRRTLHYPVYYTAAATVAAGLAVFAVGPTTVALAVFLGAAAAHCVADIIGGGLELRPWEGTSERAVFDHYRDRWIPPRRWVGYDGAPGDLAMSALLAVPLIVVVDGVFFQLTIAALVVGMAYASVRRLLPDLAERLVEDLLVGVVPRSALARIPDRYLDDTSAR